MAYCGMCIKKPYDKEKNMLNYTIFIVETWQYPVKSTHIFFEMHII